MHMRVVGLLVVLMTTPAFAQSAEVKKYLNTAITLYENLEYEKALKQLKNASAKAKGPDDEAKIGLLEAIVLADMGREERALTAFKTASARKGRTRMVSCFMKWASSRGMSAAIPAGTAINGPSRGTSAAIPAGHDHRHSTNMPF